MIIGAPRSFLALAAHLCDRCVVVTDPHPARFSHASARRPGHHRLLPLDAFHPDDFAAALQALEGS